MMFKPTLETLGKNPMWEKKRSKDRGPKSKPNEWNPKCITQGSWNDHVPKPPPIARSISERERNGKELYYLFVSLQKWNRATNPSRCNMNCSRSRGRLMALTYYR
jgi:hypothetical protein